ncbi:MAG TPA: DUF2007 domain-containing protein [Longimicrobiaceae bacterium]|nr:DUF2007 domain-containing protein [Longimicrobiaceae bacterium]
MPETPSRDADQTDILPAGPAPGPTPGQPFRCERCETEYEDAVPDADACPACGTLRQPTACAAHPERTAEGRCVICGRAVCDRCRSGDNDAFLCEEHRTVRMIEGWAQVYSTTGEIEAHLVRENLRAEGIDAQIFSQKDHMYPVDMGELSIVRLMVPVWEYGAALDIIRDHMDTEGEVVFACPSCGEAYEPGAEGCASCGAEMA